MQKEAARGAPMSDMPPGLRARIACKRREGSTTTLACERWANTCVPLPTLPVCAIDPAHHNSQRHNTQATSSCARFDKSGDDTASATSNNTTSRSSTIRPQVEPTPRNAHSGNSSNGPEKLNPSKPERSGRTAGLTRSRPPSTRIRLRTPSLAPMRGRPSRTQIQTPGRATRLRQAGQAAGPGRPTDRTDMRHKTAPPPSHNAQAAHTRTS